MLFNNKSATLLASISLFFTLLLPVHADVDTAKLHVSKAQLVGSGTLEYMIWDVYRAELYAPDGVWHRDRPFALSLQYLRDFTGDAIVKRSLREIRNQGFDDEPRLNDWRQQLAQIFPDVHPNSRLTGVVDRHKATLFYLDGRLIGKMPDPLFGIVFFDIWLGEKTSEPKLRRRLLGAR